MRAGLVAGALAGFVWAIAAGISPANAEQMARVDTAVPDTKETEVGAGDPVVLRIQRGLQAGGFYGGVLNGRLNQGTQEAIRAYQRTTNLKVDGRASKRLAVKIETTSKVEGLLGRLDKARRTHIKAARAALMRHPATRDLLSGTGGANEVADPTRDAAPCFRAPSAECLLAEASESAKAIHRQDMRDWALGEILASQARAGMTEEALITVRRIGDPRLIMVALRDISEGLAAAGAEAEALDSAAIIPDPQKRAEALAAIAGLLDGRDNKDGARQAIEQLITAVAEIDQPARQVSFRARAAVVLSRVGDAAAAQAHLDAAEALARDRLTPAEQGSPLRHIAAALAEMGRPGDALALSDSIPAGTEKLPVLVAAATAEARSGDAAKALDIAETIDSERYRAVVFSRIALAQAKAGAVQSATTTLDRAIAAASETERPYARDYGFSRAALAQGTFPSADSAAFDAAVAVAARIKDNTLRAHTLWTLAAMRKRAGDNAGNTATRTAAAEATQAIVSPLSRVWMFGDLAGAHLKAGEIDAAWAAFKDGLKVAEGVNNAWARARALGRLAAAISDLARAAAETRDD
jgi:peptidoglycan hydrolase-like protein with peptidoglycan-binding domain